MVALDPHGVNERLKERERNGDCQQEHLRIKNVGRSKNYDPVYADDKRSAINDHFFFLHSELFQHQFIKTAGPYLLFNLVHSRDNRKNGDDLSCQRKTVPYDRICYDEHGNKCDKDMLC